MRRYSEIWLIGVLTTCCAFQLSAKTRKSAPVDYAKAEITVSANTVYVGEPFIYRMYLTTDNPNIRNIREENVEMQPEVEVITGLNPRGSATRTDDGLYRMEIAAGIVSVSQPGTITFGSGTYSVDYIVPTTVYDPFWGYVQSGEVVSESVKVKGVKVKCKALPKAPADFSGAIGDFSFSCDSGSVRMAEGGEVSILYTISGPGLLRDVKVPDFKSAFAGEVRLKSVRPVESTFLQNGQLISRVTYECRVTASNKGEYSIPPVGFTYFSPEKGKYITCQSDTCVITVGRGKDSSASGGMFVYNTGDNDLVTQD